MSVKHIACPACGHALTVFSNPAPTVDIVIYHPGKGLVLVRRGVEPFGWALPGGFIDYGEMAEHAALREALEETSLRVRLEGLLGVYSNPERDPRSHTMSTVYVAEALNPETLRGGDDASEAVFFSLESLPPLVFDHTAIVADFCHYLRGQRALVPLSCALDSSFR